MFPDNLNSETPSGGASYTSPLPVTLNPGMQTFDISGAGVYIGSGGVRVAVTGSGAGVQLAADDDGITAEHNTIFTEGLWHYAEELAISNDFVIRANYTPLSGVEITKKPKSTVKTNKRKALVTFEFDLNGSGLEFECKLDDASYNGCSSPQLYKVRKGSHKFQVRATSSDVTATPPVTASRSSASNRPSRTRARLGAVRPHAHGQPAPGP